MLKPFGVLSSAVDDLGREQTIQIELNGKRVFITAGGVGMGRATALAMTKLGINPAAQLLLVDRLLPSVTGCGTVQTIVISHLPLR